MSCMCNEAFKERVLQYILFTTVYLANYSERYFPALYSPFFPPFSFPLLFYSVFFLSIFNLFSDVLDSCALLNLMDVTDFLTGVKWTGRLTFSLCQSPTPGDFWSAITNVIKILWNYFLHQNSYLNSIHEAMKSLKWPWVILNLDSAKVAELV